MANNGSKHRIDHFVVLMMENHSLDSLLGYLYPQGSPPEDRFIGQGDKMYYGIPQAEPHQLENVAHGTTYRVGPAPYETLEDMCNPSPDPGEYYDPHVLTQLYGSTDVSTDNKPVMNGFALDYFNVLSGDKKTPDSAAMQVIMNGFTRDALPVMHGLAKAFAVSDHWFCSVPSQTFCNRSFFNSGQSHGYVTNSSPPGGLDMLKWRKNTETTIFEQLDNHFGSNGPANWRVYWDPADVLPLTRLLHPQLLNPTYDANFVEYSGHTHDAGRFTQDCENGDLPKYTFIQPRLLFDHNDMHPPVPFNVFVKSSLLAGEILINNVYNAITANQELWENTLLIVTFDEHGGCFDHVPPPRAIPPVTNPSYTLDQGFTFDRAGVRVPAIFISPWIKPGTVFRAPEGYNPFDHTSMIKTLCTRWGMPGLQDRDKSPRTANVIDVLSESAQQPYPPPTFKPRKYEPILNLAEEDDTLLSDFQQHFVGLAAAHAGKSSAGLHTVGDAIKYLKELRDAQGLSQPSC